MDEVDRWVASLNKLAKKMDDIAASVHPSGWAEQLRAENEQYKQLAKKGSN